MQSPCSGVRRHWCGSCGALHQDCGKGNVWDQLIHQSGGERGAHCGGFQLSAGDADDLGDGARPGGIDAYAEANNVRILWNSTNLDMNIQAN